MHRRPRAGAVPWFMQLTALMQLRCGAAADEAGLGNHTEVFHPLPSVQQCLLIGLPRLLPARTRTVRCPPLAFERLSASLLAPQARLSSAAAGSRGCAEARLG